MLTVQIPEIQNPSGMPRMAHFFFFFFGVAVRLVAHFLKRLVWVKAAVCGEFYFNNSRQDSKMHPKARSCPAAELLPTLTGCC